MRRYLVPIPISLTVSFITFSFIYSYVLSLAKDDPVQDSTTLLILSFTALAGIVTYWIATGDGGTGEEAESYAPFRPTVIQSPITNVINEMGVVATFASRCLGLGYVILKIQAPFPDALIQDTKTGEIIRVEFEYTSSSFKDHGHDIDGCDMIICWRNDWADCPLEVLELRYD